MMPAAFVWVLIGNLCQGPVLKVCEPVEVFGPFDTADQCIKAAQALPPRETPRVCERRRV